MRLLVLSLAALASIAPRAYPQKAVDPHFTYHRVYCVVPLVGSGNNGDPVRPDYVPLPSSANEPPAADGHSIPGIIAFYSERSDDGHWALAEMVAKDRATLLPILDDTRPGVWAGEKGVVPRAEIEAAFRRLKKNIDFDHFGAVVRLRRS